jgi:hypothetical protein
VHLQLNGAPSCTHAKNHAKRDVLAFVPDFLVTKKLSDLKQLFDMEVLLTRNDVQHFVEVVLVMLSDLVNKLI